MFKLLYFVLLLIFLSKAANPGVKVVLTQKALDYASKKVVDILADEVPKIKIVNLCSKNWHNLRVSSFTKPTASVKINPGSGLTIKLKRDGLRIDASWGAKVLFLNRSKVYATSSDIDLELGVGIRAVNGKPVLSAKSCRANLGKFQLKTIGGILRWQLNFLENLFNNDIPNILEREICKIFTEIINMNANVELRTFNLVAKINNDISINYKITQQPSLESNTLFSFHEGKFLFDPVSFFSPAPMSLTLGRMVSTSISQETLNSLGRVLHAKKIFDFRFNDTEDIFNFHVYSTSAPIVSISTSKLTVKVAVDAEISVLKLVLRLGVEVEATCTVKAEEGKLKGKVSDNKLDVTLKYNSFDQNMTVEEMNEMANYVLPFLLPIINKKLDEGIPLPKIKHVILFNYLVDLYDRQISIKYDFQ